MEFAPGTVLLGKYRVDAELGVGGYGMVVRAHHLHANHEVAIKILRSDVEIDAENQERFLREAQAMVRLRSEHVAKISDVGTLDSGAPYVVMELLDGVDLGKLLAISGRLPPTVAVDLLLQACDVLAEAHALGIVHRDIKPTNLFVTRRNDGTQFVKVLDFGISKASHQDDLKTLTQTATMLGTPAYMSPEQMRSARTVDARTDIWALGAVLYELVEGRLPFDATSFAELAVMVATETPQRMGNAPELQRIITRCLAKHPDDRYPSVAELAMDLGRFASPMTAREYVTRICRVLGRQVPQAYESSPALPAAGAARRRWLVPAAIGGGLLAAVCAFAIVSASGRASDKQPSVEPSASPIEMTTTPPPRAPVRAMETVEPPAPPPPVPAPEPPPPPAVAKKPPATPPPTAPKKPPPAVTSTSTPSAGSAGKTAGSATLPARTPTPTKPPCDPKTSLHGC